MKTMQSIKRHEIDSIILEAKQLRSQAIGESIDNVIISIRQIAAQAWNFLNVVVETWSEYKNSKKPFAI